MARSKSLEKMSSEELFELARQREEQEQAAADVSKEQIAALNNQRRQLVSDHNKALVAIDRELARLQGVRGKAPRQSRPTGNKTRGQLPARVLELVAKRGPIKGRDLKQLLDGEGLTTTYLAQCLAGLKKKGQVTTPSRGVYALVK